MTDRAASDVLSLTLPRRGGRSRLRRPRRPTGWEAWRLFWMAWDVCYAVYSFATGDLVLGVYFTGCAVVWWRWYQWERAGVRRVDWLGLGWIVVGGLALLTVGLW